LELSDLSKKEIDKSIDHLVALRKWATDTPAKFQAVVKNEMSARDYKELTTNKRYDLNNAIRESTEEVFESVRNITMETSGYNFAGQPAVNPLREYDSEAEYNSEATVTDDEIVVRPKAAALSTGASLTVGPPVVASKPAVENAVALAAAASTAAAAAATPLVEHKVVNPILFKSTFDKTFNDLSMKQSIALIESINAKFPRIIGDFAIVDQDAWQLPGYAVMLDVGHGFYMDIGKTDHVDMPSVPMIEQVVLLAAKGARAREERPQYKKLQALGLLPKNRGSIFKLSARDILQQGVKTHKIADKVVLVAEKPMKRQRVA
jgi:hypothetical protein